jgi:lipid-binding SYLF domain-containing protein
MSFTNGARVATLTATILLEAAASLSAQFQPQLEVPSSESVIVDSSTQVIQEIMAIPGKGIPASLLADAEGLVILPGMIKGGFVVGVKRGHGVVLVRDPALGWQPPHFVTITGGSVGWQVGIQATDLILVFKTKKSVQGLLAGKFTIGADAAAAAGPIGREAAVATDVALKAEIYSYSRSRGLFAGVALDGSALQMDGRATAIYYQPRVAVAPGQPAPVPPSAVRLIEEITKYAKPATNARGVTATIAGAPQGGAVDPRALQQRLAVASQRLGGVVDDRWKGYLALPAEVYGGDRSPSAEALTQALGRFQTVASDPQYAALAQRAEFTETHQLLQQLITLTAQPPIALPPPPPK